MTDALTAHREANAKAADDIAARVKQVNVEFIYYQFVSINGRVLAKVVPAAHVRRSLDKGVQFHGSAAADVAADRHGELFGGGIEAAEFVVMPDPETFQVLPWEPSVGRFLCRLYRRDDAHTDPGAPFGPDCRGNLRRQLEALEARTGYELRSGCEPETTWQGEGYDAAARPGVSTAYHAGTLEQVREIYQRVIRYAQALDIDMIEGDYEDSGQIELNFMFDRADRTADRLITYRQICVQVARELGIGVTFMPKPTLGIMGNGCHHNLSLWRDGASAFADPGPAPAAGEPGPERFTPLPLILGDAVEAFADSAFARAALGDELHALYRDFKRDEWARFCGALTDWEFEMYRNWIP